MDPKKKSAREPSRPAKKAPGFGIGRGYGPTASRRPAATPKSATGQNAKTTLAAEGQKQGAGVPDVADPGPLADLRSDPDVMFRLISEKIADRVSQAALKAGTKAANIVSSKLTEELDAAIAGAQSTAGKMGTLVQQAVQAAVDDALRTAVLNATRVHEEHLAQLALIDRTAQTARDLSAVQLRIDAEMRRSGLTRITTPDPEIFNIASSEDDVVGDEFEVLAPAYVDARSGRVVQRGEMRRQSTSEGKRGGNRQ
ncbi:hypothetical protein [Streptomyces sp. E-08]|uniref:hypothetical protein n=1 Tax=Streptomyces sp. E-08 TaxID=3404047 RepID=UPI003CECF15A